MMHTNGKATIAAANAERSSTESAAWRQLQQSPAGHAADLTGDINCLLPDLKEAPTSALPDLAQQHLSSARQAASTLVQLVPAAFSTSNGVSPDLELLSALGDSSNSLVTDLIELQLRHLLKARAVIIEMRLRIQQRALGENVDSDTCSSSSSSCCEYSGGCMD